MITLKQVVVNAPAELRERLATLGDKALIARCAGFRVGSVATTTDSAKYALRALARRWQALHTETVEADRLLDQLTTEIGVIVKSCGRGISLRRRRTRLRCQCRVLRPSSCHSSLVACRR